MVMVYRVVAAVLFLCVGFWVAHSKVYDRCELAHEFRDVYKFPEKQLATWLCIAYYESLFNTSALNPGSGDHGLFQISGRFWCSSPKGNSSKSKGGSSSNQCGLPCSAFQDDDIKDDVKCAKFVYEHHQNTSGDGFTGWVVYNSHCKNPVRVASFLDGCFSNSSTTTISTTISTSPSTLTTTFRFPKLSGKPSYQKSTPRFADISTEARHPSSLKPPIKALNYKPLRAHVTTPGTSAIKVFIKHKPLNSVTRAPSSFDDLFNQISIGSGLIHRFSSTSKVPPSTVSTTLAQNDFEQIGSSLNNYETTKAPLIVNNDYSRFKSFTVGQNKFSGNPLDFQPFDNVYAVVNNPGHSFAIGSNGFKIVWNGNK